MRGSSPAGMRARMGRRHNKWREDEAEARDAHEDEDAWEGGIAELGLGLGSFGAGIGESVVSSSGPAVGT
jgi:hypothetical protein